MSRGWLVVLLFGLFPALSCGQSEESDSLAKRYPFLHLEYNTLSFPAGVDRWAGVFERLALGDSALQRPLRVLHIGGSHVQGGVLTDAIRSGLTGLAGHPVRAGVGFFFPYALAGANHPSWQITHITGKWEGIRAVKEQARGPFGLSALKAVTETPFASLHIALRHADRGIQPFKKVRIYYDIEASSLRPEPFGYTCPDTIWEDPAGRFVEWQYGTPQEALDLVLLPGDAGDDPQFVLLGLEWMDDAEALIYDVVGANGASLRTYLQCGGLPGQVQALRPDVVLFGIGVNDANVPNGRFDAEEFISRYESLMQVFLEANPDVAFLFLTNNDTWYKKRQVNRNVYQVVTAMKGLAAAHEAAVWDQFAVMGGLNSIVSWQKYGLAKSDRVHLTPGGYRLMGDLLVRAMGQAMDDYRITQMTGEE